jgi:photosystem II stability/assembly factor-like uncharacterized protein
MMLLVGTAKGLFRFLQDGAGSEWCIDGPHLAGYSVLHTMMASDGRIFAAAAHKVWGAHLYVSADRGVSWTPLAASPEHAADMGRGATKAIWYIAEVGDALLAGIDPAGLFRSDDGGKSWLPVTGLNEHPTRDTWEPSKGCFAVHSIYADPQRPDHIVAAVSAGGVYRSEDGGRSWLPANSGVRAENLPEQFPVSGHNVHRLVMHPRAPGRLYRQCYNGTYRSDDGARSWTEITEGLPSDFGYAIVVDPRGPDTVFQIPESSAHLRMPVDGKLRVYRSTDAGSTWESVSRGLPDEHVYVTVLREAMDAAAAEPCGLYFGTSGGQLFAGDGDEGRWRQVAAFLPRILSVKAYQDS